MTSDIKGAVTAWFGRLPLNLAFIGLYLALDAVSFIHPLWGLNITPWNPAPALGLVFLIRHGPSAWLAMVLAVVLADFVVYDFEPLRWPLLGTSLALAAGYVALGSELARILPRDSLLNTRRALVTWFIGVALGTLLVSLVYVFSLRLGGFLVPSGWWQALLRFWVGDGVGIAILMPLLWWLGNEQGRRQLLHAIRQPETGGYLALAVASLWLAFGLGGHNDFKLFYLLFLPIAWAAGRQGMAGAIICAAFLQLGVIVAVQVLDYSAVTVAELQILALAMALVGFFVGVVVDEKRRTGTELRHSLRLAAAGEMAGALAHELQQPLTALRAYAGACERLIERGATPEQLLAAVQCVQRESARADAAVRRLQEFYQAEPTRLESVALETLVEAAVAPFRNQAEQEGVRLKVNAMPTVSLWADRLQLEVVLRHLLSNAFEAVGDSPRHPRRILLSAFQETPERVCLQFEDSALGLTAQNATHLFDGPATGGAGPVDASLAIIRAIVDTHGGRLWGEAHHHRIFKLELPVEAASGPACRAGWPGRILSGSGAREGVHHA